MEVLAAAAEAPVAAAPAEAPAAVAVLEGLVVPGVAVGAVVARAREASRHFPLDLPEALGAASLASAAVTPLPQLSEVIPLDWARVTDSPSRQGHGATSRDLVLRHPIITTCTTP